MDCKGLKVYKVYNVLTLAYFIARSSLVKFSCAHARTNTKLLVYVELHIMLIYGMFCAGQWVVRYFILSPDVAKMIEK